MRPENTALVCIGLQNDYFHPKGILHGVIDGELKAADVLERILGTIDAIKDTPTTIVTTPIQFTPDYEELQEPVGILKAIKEYGAFKAGTHGSTTVDQITAFGDRIIEVPGKRGLNAFIHTDLEDMLRKRGVKDIVFAGAVTSVCIDSTARSAFEKGFRVSVLGDATSGRSKAEQDFYCENVFPLYARVMSANDLVRELTS